MILDSSETDDDTPMADNNDDDDYDDSRRKCAPKRARGTSGKVVPKQTKKSVPMKSSKAAGKQPGVARTKATRGRKRRTSD